MPSAIYFHPLPPSLENHSVLRMRPSNPRHMASIKKIYRSLINLHSTIFLRSQETGLPAYDAWYYECNQSKDWYQS